MALVAMGVACGGSDKTTGPDPATLVGDYRGTTFTATFAGNTSDVLAKGGSITLDLLAAGAANGELHVPASVLGTAVDETFTGTWTVDGTVVHLKDGGGSATAIGSLALTVSGTTLVADQTVSGVVVHVVFTRQ